MIRTALAAATLLAATPALSQSTTQDEIDARYDRALAAGYKALFLCSASAIASRNGTGRSAQSIHDLELTGIYPTIDSIIRELPYAFVRRQTGQVAYVKVEWAEGMPSRLAVYNGPESGCSILPMGTPEEMVRLRYEFDEPDPIVVPTNWSDTSAGRRLAASLEAPFDAALSDQYGRGTRTTAVLVMRNGSVAERYEEGFFANTPQRTWSVAKSIAATLLGAAVHRGEVDVDDSARLGLGPLGEPRHKISIDDAIRMASGRYSDTPGNRTDALYFGGATVTEVALDWPLVHEPGTVFRYANNDTLAAVQAIAAGFEENPPSDFFAKLGMHHTVAETDWKGNYILSSQVWSTARDLARIGDLYLRDGVLADGTRILPEGWVDYVSSPSGPQPDGPFGYGAGFWLFNKSEGIPSDTFAAMGNRGQFIIIAPSLNVVVVRRGEDPAGSRFDIASFTRDVLESIEE